MIKLNTQYQTSVTSTFDGQSTVTTTDTLFVSDVRLDFTTGAIYATIQKGTVVNGEFQSNLTPTDVTVNPDGTFISQDGSWSGTISGVTTLVSSLKSQFDAFVLASGVVTGTAE